MYYSTHLKWLSTDAYMASQLPNYLFAIRCQHTFRMKLHTLHIILFMLQCHDIFLFSSLAVISSSAGKSFLIYNPAMITTNFNIYPAIPETRIGSDAT